jgi:cytosine/adenosine deaminase-related metal-dependent hydrolase/SAM-dependent methyltransferase
MASHCATPVLSAREGYRRWARVYDTEPNPMLSLERRFLQPLLPNIHGLDVVDLGCGTGRWLEILAGREPHSLLGVDSSPEMLRRARRKLKNNAQFLHSDRWSSTLPAQCADLILGNFVLSYVENAAAFLRIARSALRDGGSLFLTDVHPGTSAALQWQRGVRSETGFQQIRTFERAIESVITLCESAGLRLCARLEPQFGEPEKQVFTSTGKLASFEQAAGHPAIYILQFRAGPPRDSRIGRANKRVTIASIQNASIVIGPHERAVVTLSISDSRIEAISLQSPDEIQATNSGASIDLHGFLLFPGLINSHDHLEFGLFPRLGKGDYENSLQWAEDIHTSDSEIIAKHRQVPRETRLRWGGIRNLLCGVATVSHHNPYEAEIFENDFPVRVVRDYGWAHSLSLDADATRKKRQTPANRPFLIHLAEGIDRCSGDEIDELHRAGALDKNTLLIHGLALNNAGRALVRTSGAGLIWCPSSNVFLFGRTLEANEIESLPFVALGSDSPLTAEGDLLDELRFAHRLSQLPVDKLYNFVAGDAAQLLRLRNGEGTIRVGGFADFFAVRDTGNSPADTLAALSYRDIELVLIGGHVQLATDEMLCRLPESAGAGLQCLTIEGVVRWIRAPLDRLFQEASAHIKDGLRLGGKRVSVGVNY